MQILFVAENFPLYTGGSFQITGGVERVALSVAEFLSKTHCVTVITNYRCSERISTFGNLTIMQCGRKSPYSYAGGLLKRALFQSAAYRTGKAIKADLVVAWNFISYSPAYRIARKNKIPCVAWYADVWLKRWRKLFGLPGLIGEIAELRTLKKRWSKFIAISDWTASQLQKNGIEKERIVLIPPIVELEREKNHRNSSYVFKQNTPIELSVVSRLVPYKRVDLILRVVALVNKSFPRVSISIVGSGPELRNLQKLSQNLGIADKIRWLGWLIDHSEVLSVIGSSDLYIHASEVEGFGITTVESALQGVPYVASNIPALRYATKGSRGGLLFEPGNVEDCAKSIINLLCDADLYAKKSVEGRKLMQEYSSKTVGLRFEELLQHLSDE